MFDQIEKSVAVVIPMANEKNSAIEFLLAVLQQTSNLQKVAIYTIFDKSCTDGTVYVVRELSTSEPRIRVVWAPEIQCVAEAYLKGYREALISDADWILEIDAGNSHSPADIPKFVGAMRSGYECAFGSRFCAGGRMLNAGWRRYIVSRGGSILTNYLMGTTLSDMTSGFQMFTKGALSAVLERGINSRGPFFQTEMKIHARQLKNCEIPISYMTNNQSIRSGSLADAFRILVALCAKRLKGELRAASI